MVNGTDVGRPSVGSSFAKNACLEIDQYPTIELYYLAGAVRGTPEQKEAEDFQKNHDFAFTEVDRYVDPPAAT